MLYTLCKTSVNFSFKFILKPLKILWKKEKILASSIFDFPYKNLYLSHPSPCSPDHSQLARLENRRLLIRSPAWQVFFLRISLLTVIAPEFIPLTPLSIVSMMAMWESSQWLREYCVEYW